MVGWQCPGCGACYSPFVEKCGNCAPRAALSTTTNPTPWYQPANVKPLTKPPENTG